MTDRWALAAAEDGGAELAPLGADGLPAGPVLREPDLAEAVRSRPDVTRWVWRSTAAVYPRLLAAGVRVRALLRHRGRRDPPPRPRGPLGEPRSAAAALARIRGTAVPPDPPQRAATPGSQSSLFEPQPVHVPLEDLIEVYADQQRRHDATAHPGRMRLLTAAESAAMLVAAEMNAAGLPWSADVHRSVLHELLGERYAGGGEPRRLAELADEVSEAFGRRVRPDLPADVVKAFAQAGVKITSTRRWEIESIDHPAVRPLIEYKKLYRIYTAHGWSWLQDWVRDGRFRPEYLPGRHRHGTLGHQWRRRTPDPQGHPPCRRRRPGLAARRRRRRPDGTPRPRRDLPRPRPDGGRRAGDRPLPVRLRPGLLRRPRTRPSSRCSARCTARRPATASRTSPRCAAASRKAVAYVDDAARAGEEGRLVRTWLGRTCPPAAASATGEEAGIPQEQVRRPNRRHSGDTEDWCPGYASSNSRARGRFARNFVVQGSAADWTLLVLAALRRPAGTWRPSWSSSSTTR